MDNKVKNVYQLVDLYTLGLRDYLDGAGEVALQGAYELGRSAMANGLGVLEMISIHEQAKTRILSNTPHPEQNEWKLRMAEFLTESLSPFEMAHRGIRETNTRLRLLSEHLQLAREEERARIARDIHDELGQALTCLKMDLSWLSSRLSGQGPLAEKTGAMLKLVDETIQTVKRLSTVLRPAVLDDLGLVAAIEWQAEEFQARTGIQCTLRLPAQDITLDPKRSTAIFRIFQETLTNVARHANATRVQGCLEKKNDHLILEVTDNGRGIEQNEISSTNALGLLGMRERASFLGGDVQIRGVQGKGTTVTIRIPMAGRESY